MTDLLRCALLVFDVFIIASQLSTWQMNYGFALGVHLDVLYSLILIVLLLLRGIWGPISLPYLRNAVVQVLYIVSSSIGAGLATARLVYCLYLRHMLLNHWPPNDGLRNIRYDYYFMESVMWMLQAILNASMVFDLTWIRTHVD